MPELPEVQTIADDLRKALRGWKVAGFFSDWEKNVFGGDVVKFNKAVVGKEIADVSRIGKYILIKLHGGKGILVHLRMTGALLAQVQSSKFKISQPALPVSKKKNQATSKYFENTKAEKNNQGKQGVQKRSDFQFQTSNFPKINHVRHWWVLKKGKKEMRLLFSDVRKFGTVDLVDLGTARKHKSLCKLGTEPLSKAFDQKVLTGIFKKKQKQIVRNVLLDQNCVCGIGNIYVSEILFDAGINPKRVAGSLSKKELAELLTSIKKILAKAIKFRGTTFSDYRDSSGRKGGFQNFLKVYNRGRGNCLRKGCKGIIIKQKINQRSAYWCPVCQK